MSLIIRYRVRDNPKRPGVQRGRDIRDDLLSENRAWYCTYYLLVQGPGICVWGEGGSGENGRRLRRLCGRSKETVRRS